MSDVQHPSSPNAVPATVAVAVPDLEVVLRALEVDPTALEQPVRAALVNLRRALPTTPAAATPAETEPAVPAPVAVTLAERRDAAYAAGYAAAMAGALMSSCPYSRAQGSPTRIEAFGWSSGYERAEVDEAEGQHFRTTA